MIFYLQPSFINIDKSGANTCAINSYNKEYNKRIKIRQNKYLNNIVEDHRSVKRIYKPMLSLKNFHSAQKTIKGIELMSMIRKGQMRVHKNDRRSNDELFYSLAA